MSKYTKEQAKLEIVKTQLFFKRGSGFLGALLCNLEFEWCEKTPTASVDGLTLRWNPDWFMSMTLNHQVTVLAHEIWHVAFQHMFQRGTRDPKLWNIAGDHVINLLLKEHGYDFTNLPHVADSKFTGWTTVDIYNYLEQNTPPEPPQGGIGQDIKEPEEDNSNGSDSSLDGDDLKSIQASKAMANASMMKVIAAATAAEMTNEAGSIPGEISLTIKEYLNPILPWRIILRKHFNEITEYNYSFARPNRRYQDPILPGKVGNNGLDHLIYYLDVSGSISDKDILRFNSEVKSIKEDLNPAKLTLVTFDTKIRDEYVFDQYDNFEKIIVTGRGGTNLFPVMAHMEKHMPNAAVIFTDLYLKIPPKKPKCPLIWICNNEHKTKVPYGKLIHIKE